MDRERLIAELTSTGLLSDDGRLQVHETLGRGGNGVALLCSGDTIGEVVAKVYIPPDKRDLDDQSMARFQNEVKLASTIRNPYVVPAIGSGTARIGAYVLPYYLMPQAASTLRSAVGPPRDAAEIQRLCRLFLQACLGVSCLHSHHIVHRDLKPENVLISRDGTAWVADLGIAHIDPDFVSVSLRTIAAERLLNRDYYAPEQRFGDPGDVDARADIYALGCILYELFVGAPPVRRDSPPVASLNPDFAALDAVIDRMTSYEPTARYQHLEAAIIDVALGFGWVTATARGARQPAPKELKEMTKLLRSANGANRSAGTELAVQLGAEALPDLHELMGHSRREVRNAVASALGAIADERSVPYLVAGLHGLARNASQFQPSVDTAADALARYPIDVRTATLRDLAQPIRPVQLLKMLHDFESAASIKAVQDLHARKLLLLGYTESHLELLVAIDEPGAWTYVRAEALQIRGWSLSQLLPRLDVEHQLDLARAWLRGAAHDVWDWDRMIPAICDIPAVDSDLAPLLQEMLAGFDAYPGPWRKTAAHRASVEERLREAGGPSTQP